MNESQTLSKVDSTRFRALSSRANFLAQDRMDIPYSVKEMCRRKLRRAQRIGLSRSADVQPEAPAEVWLHEDRIA